MTPEPKFLFVSLCLTIAVIDVARLKIPNIIVIPGAVLGALLTTHWEWAAAMFVIGAAFFGFSHECPKCGYSETHTHPFSFLRGGDVKLLAMLGAFLASNSLAVFGLALLGTVVFRKIRDLRTEPLPFAPFVFIASVPFVLL